MSLDILFNIYTAGCAIMAAAIYAVRDTIQFGEGSPQWIRNSALVLFVLLWPLMLVYALTK